MKLSFITFYTQFQRLIRSPLGKTAVIYPLAFLAGAAGNISVLGMVFYADGKLNASPQQVGMLGAVFTVSYVIGCFLLRPVINLLHPRHTLLISTSLFALIIYILSASTSLLWVFVLFMLFGLTTSLFWPPMMGWVSSGIDGLELSRAMSWFSLSWSSGSIIGHGLAGLLSDISVRLPLVVAGTTYLAGACILLGALFTMPHLAKPARSESNPKTSTAVGKIPSKALRWTGWIGVLSVFISVGLLNYVFPIAAMKDLSFTRGKIGSILLVRGLAYSILLASLGRFKFWHFRSKPMQISLVLTALMISCFIWVTDYKSFLFLGLILGVMMAFSYTASLFHSVAGESDLSHRTKRLAIHEAMTNGGSVIGAMFGGVAYGCLNARAAYAACSILILLGFMAQVRLNQKKS